MEQVLLNKTQIHFETILSGKNVECMDENEMLIVINGNKRNLFINKQLSRELKERGYNFVSFQKTAFEKRFFFVFSNEDSLGSQKLVFLKSLNLAMNDKNRIADIFDHLKIHMKDKAIYIIKIERLKDGRMSNIIPFLIRKVELENHDIQYILEDDFINQ